MDRIYLISRNDVGGFVERTLKNLELIENAYNEDNDVHVVTQLVLSMLGLIVFPLMEDTERSLEDYDVADLNPNGVEIWHITHGVSKNLHDHLRHLRNAIAHRRIEFSSDSRIVGDVIIEFTDARKNNARLHWQAQINASDLRAFCFAFGRRLTEL